MAWIVATSGTSHSAFSVSPAHATSQSWAVDDVGPPVAELRRQLRELVVGRGHAGDEVVVGHPRQIGAGSEHANAVDHRVVAGVGVVQREDDDLVAGPGERTRQPVDVRGDAADDERWVLPGQHRDTHRAERSGPLRRLRSETCPARSSVISISTCSARATTAGCGSCSGAHVTAGGARFAVWAPNARRVSVTGDWNDWTPGEDDLAPTGPIGLLGG